MGDCIEERGLADAVHLVHLGLVMVMVMVMACRHIPTMTKSHHGREFEAKTFCLAAFR